MENNSYLNISGNLMRLFIAIYDHNSISKAANKLDINQSAASYNLEKLRLYLDDPLFVKAGRGITPTDRAISIVPQVRAQLASLEDLVSNERYQPKLESRLTTISANIETILPQLNHLKNALAIAAPEMPLRFLELGSRENLESVLANGSADIAISVRMKQYPVTLNFLPLFESNMVCFYDGAERTAVKTQSDYFNSMHATLDFGGGVSSVVDGYLENHKVERNKMLFAPNAYALSVLIKGSKLIATMPLHLKDSVFSEFSYSCLPVHLEPVKFDIVWHRRSEHAGRSIWLRNMIGSFMRAEYF